MGALLEGPSYRHRYAILGSPDVAHVRVVNDGSVGVAETQDNVLPVGGTAWVQVVDEATQILASQVRTLAQPTIQSEYSLSRPLIVNNPGCLLAGDDWQSYANTDDLLARSGFRHLNSDITVTRSAALVSDVLFGQVPECIHGDSVPVGSRCYDPNNPPQTQYPIGVMYARSWPAVRSAWARVTMFFVDRDPNDPRVLPFDLATYCFAGTNPGWKVHKFGTLSNSDRCEGVVNSDAHYRHFNEHGGTGFQSRTANAVQGSGLHWNDTKWTSIWPAPNASPPRPPEWWEWIYFLERIVSGPDAGEYRQIKQRRQISTANATVFDPRPFTPGSGAARFHQITNGATDTSDPVFNIHLSENRNGPTPPGTIRKWRWGPYEVIDNAVVPDPYGLRATFGI